MVCKAVYFSLGPFDSGADLLRARTAGQGDPADSFTAGAVEFKVIGTAVRASEWRPLARPFVTDLSGQDFAKLVTAGWVPAEIAPGISVAALHDDLLTTSSGRWGTGNAEVRPSPV